MTKTADLLATLNTLRAINGKAPIKAWKESRAKLEAAIAALTPAQSLGATEPAPAPTRAPKKVTSTFKDLLTELNMTAKVARAKLRRAKVAKPYKGDDATRTILTTDNRKK